MDNIDLLCYGNPLRTVFDLLGDKENDRTRAIGWALARCPTFRIQFLQRVLPSFQDQNILQIRLQHHDDSHGGFTDIEIVGEHFHVIVEAKCGWNLPSTEQLEKYARRIETLSPTCTVIVVLSECHPEYVTPERLQRNIQGISVEHVNYRDLVDVAEESKANANHAQKRLLEELRQYLGAFMTLQQMDSNLVFVVALNDGIPSWSSISWIEFVQMKRRYFHPIGNRWPKSPPNYIAFRFSGRLQSIHHIDEYIVVANGVEMHTAIPEIDATGWQSVLHNEHHYVYTLGAAIYPPQVVRTGAIPRSAHARAAIDLLLTCSTISDAAKQTNIRKGQS